METDIKRINFFDGLFLRQGEFLAEQQYHLHMRRRLNYMLFDGSGVVQVEPGDLQIITTGAKTFHVTPGMAISRRTDLLEGREIILKDNSPTFDLGTTFTAGDNVLVAIHYEERPTDAQTLVPPNTSTRVEEVAVVTLHNAIAGPPAAGSLPGGESPVILGRIAFDTMAVDSTQRQTAKLRASLVGTGPSPGATLTSIAVSPTNPTVTVGSTQAFTATGTFSDATTRVLTPADGLAWSSTNTAVLTINSTTGVATGVLAGGPVTVRATVGAINGTATAAVAGALVSPVITLVSPAQQASGGTVDVRGSNIRNPGLAVGAVAAGTTVRLTGPGGFVKSVPPVNVIVRPDVAGVQAVRVTIPDRTGTTWIPKQIVTLELSFGVGAPATSPFQYDD